MTPPRGLVFLLGFILLVPRAHAQVSTFVVGDFSAASVGAAAPADWTALTFRNVAAHTRYTVTRDADGRVAVKAESSASASGLIRKLDLSAEEWPLLRWRWKVDRAIEGSDVTRKGGDDYPARIYVTFRAVPERMSLAQRARASALRILYGEEPPYAGLNYIWDARSPVGAVVPNPFTDRVRMFVVESGTARIGRWLDYERDLVADYRAAFGEDPPPISGIAIMTDSDNTGESAVAWYGDIALAKRK